MPLLDVVANNVWAYSVPHSFMGLHVGARMTVVKLSAGGLLLHSPVPVDEPLAQEPVSYTHLTLPTNREV